MTLTEFLLARISEDEAVSRTWHSEECDSYRPDFDGNTFPCDCKVSARVLAECEAKRRIVEFHKSWPVLVETPPTFDMDSSDPSSMTMRMSKQVAWTTEQKYREHFGTEPPSGPIIRALAAVYADHPDYRDEWRP